MSLKKGVILLLAAFAPVACGDSEFTGPAVQEIAGDYVVSGTKGEFFFQTESQTWDLAAEGSIVELKVLANGTTQGRLFVPAATETAEPLEADLAGRWYIEGNAIYFAQNEQNLISAMEFHRDGNQLRAERQFMDGYVRLTLVK